MEELSGRVLTLDSDSDTFISLQRAFENAEIDTTITWDEAEARLLIETAPFDLLLIGDHPPEQDPAAIIEDLRFRGMCPSVLVLQTAISKKKSRVLSQGRRKGSSPRGRLFACAQSSQKVAGFAGLNTQQKTRIRWKSTCCEMPHRAKARILGESGNPAALGGGLLPLAIPKPLPMNF